MRTLTDSTTRVELPDYLTYRGDDNYVRVYDSGGVITATITIDGSLTLTYESETYDITFDIRDALRTLAAGSHTVAFSVYHNGTLRSFATQNIYLVDGWTRARVTHGRDEYVTVPDGITHVDVLWAASGYGSYNNTSSPVTEGVATVVPNNDGTVVFTPSSGGGPFGEIYDQKTIGYTLNIDYRCTARKGIIVAYRNADGCIRYAVGKWLGDTSTVEVTEYHRRDGVMNRTPRRHVNEYSDVAEIGIENVKPQQYLDEILMSDEVWLPKENDMHVIPADLTFKRTGEQTDAVLKIKIQR